MEEGNKKRWILFYFLFVLKCGLLIYMDASILMKKKKGKLQYLWFYEQEDRNQGNCWEIQGRKEPGRDRKNTSLYINFFHLLVNSWVIQIQGWLQATQIRRKNKRKQYKTTQKIDVTFKLYSKTKFVLWAQLRHSLK